MKPAQVAILGCGPAGLLAAHATILKGHEPRVFSIKQKSLMPGAQYLHQPIPNLETLRSDEPDGAVTYVKWGTQQGYAQKVYGSADAPCSWTQFNEGEHDIWSLGKMYDELWEKFDDSIEHAPVGPADIERLMQDYRMVISTIPLHRLCHDGLHTFENTQIWVKDSLPESGLGKMARDNRSNFIIYNGHMKQHWYRVSSIFGKESCETTQPKEGWSVGHKPLSSDCHCHEDKWPGRFYKVGRFGKWQKGILVHQAFWMAIKHLAPLGRGAHAVL